MSRARPSTLAERQAERVAALVAGGPTPSGFDRDDLDVARRALLRKRAGSAAVCATVSARGAASGAAARSARSRSTSARSSGNGGKPASRSSTSGTGPVRSRSWPTRPNTSSDTACAWVSRKKPSSRTPPATWTIPTRSQGNSDNARAGATPAFRAFA